MYCDGHGCGSVQTPEQHGSVEGFTIASETFLDVIQEQRSQLKPSTVDDVLLLHSNPKPHAKHQIVLFPGDPI